MLTFVLVLTLAQGGTVAVDRETPADAPNTRYYFSSRSASDAAQFGWKKLDVAFYALNAPLQGAVPVYCDSFSHLSYRFTRGDVAPGWARLFIAFYAFPDPVPGAEPVYEESQGGQFNYAMRSQAEAAQYGWERGHIAFWALPKLLENGKKRSKTAAK